MDDLSSTSGRVLKLRATLATLSQGDTVRDTAGRVWRLIADADPAPGSTLWVVADDDPERSTFLVPSAIAEIL